MNKITKDYLQGEHIAGESFDGYILVRDVNRGLTKNNSPYFYGLLSSEVDIPYKIWDSVTAFKTMESTNLENRVAYVSGSWSEYRGQFSIEITSLVEDKDGEYSVADFLPVVYDKETYWKALRAMSEQLLSPDIMEVACKTLFDNEEVAKAFKTEYAAKSHHDNCPSGLLAHTYKVCYLTQVSLSLYGGIVDKDLLFLGALLHDIGKTKEMNFGAYQPCSKVTHRYLGIEILPKDLIVEKRGIDWFYELVSIMLQHHGQWGDPCKTVSARFVNLIDEFEAKMQDMKQRVELAGTLGDVVIDGQHLSYMV